MKYRKLCTCAALLLLIPGTAGWFWIKSWSASPASVAGSPPPPSRWRQSPSAINVAEYWPGNSRVRIRQFTHHAEKWFSSRGRDAASLIAAWEVSGEKSLLAEAAEKYPNDPRVALAMIADSGDDPEKAAPWVERFAAAEPDNPHSHFLKAWLRLSAGDRKEALEILRHAVLLKSPRDIHQRDRILTIREGALASGMDAGRAAYVAVSAAFSNSQPHHTQTGSIVKALRQEIQEAQTAGDEQRILDIAGTALAFARQYDETPAGLLVDSLVAMTVEQMVLDHLADDVEVGTEGVTAAQLRKNARKRHQEWSAFLRQSDDPNMQLENGGDALLSGYTDQVLLRGEMAARKWLLQQQQQQQPVR